MEDGGGLGPSVLEGDRNEVEVLERRRRDCRDLTPIPDRMRKNISSGAQSPVRRTELELPGERLDREGVEVVLTPRIQTWTVLGHMQEPAFETPAKLFPFHRHPEKLGRTHNIDDLAGVILLPF
jgi:hypothetical protein